MPRCQTKTWTAEEIERAIEAVRRVEHCPQCPSMTDPAFDSPSSIEVTGPWTLSVGAHDVIATAPARCLPRSHVLIVRADLWRRARTPVGGPKIKTKLVPRAPQRPRPLQHI